MCVCMYVSLTCNDMYIYIYTWLQTSCCWTLQSDVHSCKSAVLPAMSICVHDRRYGGKLLKNGMALPENLKFYVKASKFQYLSHVTICTYI